MRNGKRIQVKDPSLRSMLNRYELGLKALNRSNKTISWYLEILERYFGFLESRNLFDTFEGCGRSVLGAYVLDLQNSTRWANSPHRSMDPGKLSPISIQGHVRAIKAFWSWLLREGYIENNPIAKYSLPRAPQKELNILSPEQVGRILSLIDKGTLTGIRNYLIVLMLYDGGFRISELVNIRQEDLDVRDNFIRVSGKGQKQRMVPVSSVTRREINRYIRACRYQSYSAENPHLFRTSDDEPLTINAVQQFLRRIGKKAGIRGIRCSPHTFRHSFATQFLSNGGDVFGLKNIMGHSSLQTTLKYVHLSPQDIQIQHAKFSPVRSLRKS